MSRVPQEDQNERQTEEPGKDSRGKEKAALKNSLL